MKYFIFNGFDQTQVQLSLEAKFLKYQIVNFYDRKIKEKFITENPGIEISNCPCFFDDESEVVFPFKNSFLSAEKTFGLMILAEELPDEQKYIPKRKMRYEEMGLGVEDLLMGYIQKDMDNDPTIWNALKAIRDTVKEEIPKE